MQGNRTLIQKADMSLAELISDGGHLAPATAKKFLQKAIKAAKLSGLITVTGLESPVQTMENLQFGSRVLQPGVSGEALTVAQRSKPGLGKETWNARLFRAEIRIPDEVLEDNIEGEGLKNTIMDRAAEAVGRDTEEVMIQGDTDSSDNFLKTMNGIIKQASSNTVDCNGQRLTRAVCQAMVRKLPKEYIRDMAQMVFLTSHNAQDDYADALGSRATVLGDSNVVNDEVPKYRGKAIVDIPMWPETLGGGSNETVAILVNPKNIYLGFWRKIKIATAQDVSSGEFIVVLSIRFDARYADEDGVVKATEVLNS